MNKYKAENTSDRDLIFPGCIIRAGQSIEVNDKDIARCRLNHPLIKLEKIGNAKLGKGKKRSPENDELVHGHKTERSSDKAAESSI